MPSETTYTALPDIDAKLDIIEHVNQDHVAEVLLIAQEYFPNLTISQAHIADMFVEGMTVTAQTAQGPQTLFVEFALAGELEEQILYLAYLAMAKQGKTLAGDRKQYFEVIGKQSLTKNMTRLTLRSPTPLPSDYAGYAYGMVLKVLKKTPKKSLDMPESMSTKLAKKYGMQAFLWVLKKFSSTRRQKIVDSMGKDIRFYTVRKTWQSDDADFINQGYMDAFTHNNSSGSQWIDSLNTGDIVFSRSETNDKHSHLQTGHAVLIADEAAYPALAGILDFWDNPIAPHIIVLSQNDNEQSYFAENDFPTGSVIHRVIAAVDTQAKRTLELLEDIENIELSWGALENKQAKVIRHYLRNERGLSGKQNHFKGYWKADK